MQFTPADIAAMLAAPVGEEIIFSTSAGAAIKTVQGKFRKESRVESPFDAERTLQRPRVMLATADLVGITRLVTVTARGVTYKIFGDPEDQDNGFSVLELGKS